MRKLVSDGAGVAAGALNFLRELRAQPATLVILIAALPAVLLWPSMASLVEVWNDPLRVEMSHGVLTPAIVIGLLWYRRREIAQSEAAPSRMMLVVLLLLSALWLLVWRAGIQVAHQLLLPAIAAATVWAVFGRRIAVVSGFALGYLFFAIPVWTILNGPLQSVSAVAVRAMLRVLDIPAHLSGRSIEIIGGVFEIADGCSGLRLLLVGLAIAVLYGELIRASVWRRVFLVVLAALLSAFANWLRILIIVGAAHYFGMGHPLVGDHVWLGWVVFAAGMMVFLWVGNRLPERPDTPAEAGPQRSADSVWNRRQFLGPAIGVVAVLGAAPAWDLVQRSSVDSYHGGISSLVTIPGWERQLGAADWRPNYIGADRDALASYEAGARNIDLYVATYFHQSQGRELVGFGNSIFGDSIPLSVDTRLAQAAGSGAYLSSYATEYGGARWLYRHSYVIGADVIANPLHAQLRYGLLSLWRIPVSSVVIARTRCGLDDCQDAQNALDEVWNLVIESSIDSGAERSALRANLESR